VESVVDISCQKLKLKVATLTMHGYSDASGVEASSMVYGLRNKGKKLIFSVFPPIFDEEHLRVMKSGCYNTCTYACG
jgi:hypothetical protein